MEARGHPDGIAPVAEDTYFASLAPAFSVANPVSLTLVLKSGGLNISIDTFFVRE